MSEGEVNVLPGTFVDVATLAAQNVATTLGLPDTAVESLKRAMSDEVRAMTSHFALAFQDVQEQCAKEIERVRSGWNYAKQNQFVLLVWAASIFVTGFVTGALLRGHG